MASIKDVAKLANTSAMTVSRVLRTPEKVKDSTREKVLEAIKTLDYKLNISASLLSSKRTGIIQLVMSKRLNFRDAYFLELLAGISETLCGQQYSLYIQDSITSKIKCDGMIIMGLTEDREEALFSITEPFVVFGKTKGDFDWIDVNNTLGIATLTNTLIEYKHQSIYYFGVETDESYSREREKGYRDMMVNNGLEPVVNTVLNSPDQNDFSKYLDVKSLPSAIVCGTDMIALGVIDYLKQHHIRIPEDVSITGFDGILFDQLSSPKITTAKQPLYEIGKRLALTVIEKVENNVGYLGVKENITTEMSNKDTSICPKIKEK